jgi:hypothetical protein
LTEEEVQERGDYFAKLILKYVVERVKRGNHNEKVDKTFFVRVRRFFLNLRERLVDRDQLKSIVNSTPKDAKEFCTFFGTRALAVPIYYVIKYTHNVDLVKLLLVNQASCEDAFKAKDRKVSIAALESGNNDLEKVVYYGEIYCRYDVPFIECTSVFPEREKKKYT